MQNKERRRNKKAVSIAFVLFIYLVSLVFQDRFSLYSPGCPGTCFVVQANL